MTSAGTGHPDWQSYANWRGELFSVDSSVIPTTGQDFGFFVTTNYAAIYVDVFCASGFGEMTLTWYSDATGNNEIAVDAYPMAADTSLTMIVPCRGNAVNIAFDVTSPGPATLSLTVLPTNTAPTHTTFFTGPTWIADVSMSVAHSTNRSMNAVPIVGGPAYLTFVPHDATGKLTLDVWGLDNDGTKIVRVGNYAATTVPVQTELILPPLPLQYIVTNTDTVSAHVYDLSIIARTQ